MSEPANDALPILDAGDVSDELRERPTWVCWAKEVRNGKATKIPKNPDGSGDNAKSNDMATWGTFDEARETAERRGWGVGFMFSSEGPYLGIDLDSCLNDHDGPAEWLREGPGIELFNGSAFMERSPSGTGIHVITRNDGEIPEWWVNQEDDDADTDDDEHAPGIEAYDSGRFFTVTGDTIETSTDEIEQVDPDALTEWFRVGWDVFNDEPPIPDDESGSSGNSGNGSDLGIDVYDILSRSEYPADKRREHPEHGSSTGANFHVDEGGETWRCWRHSTTGNAGHLLGLEAGILDCGEWNRREISAETWREICDYGRNAGYDLADPTPSRRSATVEADGGTAAATPNSAPTPTDDATDADDGTMGWETIRELFRSNERGTTGEATQAAAMRILAKFDLITIEETDTIWRYNPNTGVFTDDGVARLRKYLADGLNFTYSRSRVADVLHRVRSETFAKRDALGAPDDMVCVENGVLDLSDPENPTLLDHSPKYRFTWALNARYNPDAEATQFRQFLGESVRPEDIPKLQEYAGDALQHWQQPRNLCVLIGPTDSGKGVFIRVLRAVFGDDNVASETLKDLTDTRWGAHSLQHRPINLANELSTGTLDNPEKAKNFSGGGDKIPAEDKGESKYEMEPTANHIFATNQVPQVSNADPAFYNRWLFVTFPERVPTDEQDEELDTRMIETDEERAGILNWLIEGYARRQTRDGTGFDGERSIAEREDMWAAYGTSIDRFVATCITTDGASDDDAIPKKDAYAAYKTMCNAIGVSVESQRKLTTEIKKVDGADTSKRKVDSDFDDRSRVPCYTGVRWTDDGEKHITTAMHAHRTDESDDDQAALADPDGWEPEPEGEPDQDRKPPGEIAQEQAVEGIKKKIRELSDEGREPVEIETVVSNVVHSEDRARHIIDNLLTDGTLIEEPEGAVRPTQ